MTRDDIIQMAAVAGMTGLESSGILENFERFAALVAAVEREACAKVCDDSSNMWVDHHECAAAIRARGEKP